MDIKWRKFSMAILFVTLIGFADTAVAQVPVNIVYPINGSSYPIQDPASKGLKSAYFTASFSATCGGGSHKVEWGFDKGMSLGAVRFYDQTSLQFVHKLSGGVHVFWVQSDCGKDEVKFKIGN